MTGGLSFVWAPLLPFWGLVAIASIGAALVLVGLLRGVRGGWLRAVALAALVLAIANPSLLREDREPLKTVVAVVTDASDSQKLDGRTEQTEQAKTALSDLLARFPDFEVRDITARNGGAETGDASMCAPWTLIGAPAICLPAERGARGLPLGLQLVSPWLADATLLRVAAAAEAALATAS